MDIKKIVALSTLSQLGLMVSCLGFKLPEIAYFHLLTHAFIKALLFIGIGNAIHFSSDYQDIRKVNIITRLFPSRRAFILCSNLGLIGIPFLAGFYSKDIWLEIITIRANNHWSGFMVMIGVVTTAAYRTRLIYFLFIRRSTTNRLSFIEDKAPKTMFSIFTLWLIRLVSGASLG